MFQGPLAWCDIPGLARIEFSLLHLKNSRPLGVLQNGVIDIENDGGTTLHITNVKNGVYQDVLSGGPYRVWVRWSKPTQTVEEYRKFLKQQIVTLKERAKSGDLSLPPGRLERLEKQSESDHVGLLSCGVGQVKPSDLAEPE
jgi:hypothetical protein